MSHYHFKRSARSAQALIFVALWWLVLALLYILVNAAPLIVITLGVASLPALIDIAKGGAAHFQITESDIKWQSGRRTGQLTRASLKSVRLETRLDLSLRMTLVTHLGDKTRLPYECVPPASQIEAALGAQKIPFERHHFTLMG